MKRIEGLLAGVLLGVIFLCYVFACIGCLDRRADTSLTWSPVEVGRWVVVPPERAFVVVEVKLNVADDRHYMRISTVPFPRPEPTPDTSRMFAMVTSRKIELAPAQALDKTVAWIEATDEIKAMHAWWTHECCDCASTHRVLSVPTAEGLRMLWWKDERETRKKRMMRGIGNAPHWTDEWSPDHP